MNMPTLMAAKPAQAAAGHHARTPGRRRSRPALGQGGVLGADADPEKGRVGEGEDVGEERRLQRQRQAGDLAHDHQVVRVGECEAR